MKVRRGAIAVALFTVALAVTAAAVACTHDNGPPPSAEVTEPSPIPEVVDLSQIKKEAVRALFNDTGRMINPDRQLADVERDHEGGFGGFYFHDTDKSIVFVYMLDVTKAAAAEAAFRAAYKGDREIAQIIPVQGEYSFDQLFEWFNILDRALIESRIPPAESSVREIENRIRIGLFDADQIDDAHRIMEKLGIPEGAVIVEKGDRIRKRSK